MRSFLQFLFFCLLPVISSEDPSNSTNSLFQNGDEKCEVDLSLLSDMHYFFAVTPHCHLFIDTRLPITFDAMRRAVEKDSKRSSAKRKKPLPTKCAEWLPSFFETSKSTELGFYYRDNIRFGFFGVIKIEDTPNGADEYNIVSFVDAMGINVVDEKDRCYMDNQRDTLRCYRHVRSGQGFINYTDYEGEGTADITPFAKKNWTFPTNANIASTPVLAYFDKETKHHRIWTMHNLQWFYNIDMDEDVERKNRNSRLTTYHLANKFPDRPYIVPVYADSKGLVTAHCTKQKTSCYYVYNSVDAKSGMDGTCLIHLDYLTVVGAHSTGRKEKPKPVAEPQVQNYEEEEEEIDESGQFLPLYILIICTFLFVLAQIIFAFICPGKDDLQDLYMSMERELARVLHKYERAAAMKRERAEDKRRQLIAKWKTPLRRGRLAKTLKHWQDLAGLAEGPRPRGDEIKTQETQKSSDNAADMDLEMDTTQRTEM